MPLTTFDFEADVAELEQQLADELAKPEPDAELAERLQGEVDEKLTAIYAGLTPWQRVQVARHVERPRAMDYVAALMTDFTELHGDRAFGDDQAVIAGFAEFRGQRVAIVAQQKGKDTKDNLQRNWGMMHPEGYRKAMRVMNLASKFGVPIVVLIDTPGAFPGIGAEERGQAEAIAKNIRDMFLLEVPVICIVIGEGASGGALGVGVGDRIFMLENAWYCVISPEGCAAILWKDRAHAEKAAEALKLTASDLISLGIADGIIAEPAGGAHRKPEVAYENVAATLQQALTELGARSKEELQELRYAKFRAMGQVTLAGAEH